MDIAIETHHLTKVFERPRGLLPVKGTGDRAVTAVDNVNLTVYRGELFGLLGPNGAGKTTLTKMLCTLVLPSNGTATVNGRSLDQAAAIQAAVGLVVSDERSFYWRLSGRQNLIFYAAMHSLHGRVAAERVQQLLIEVDLLAQADRRFSDYSTGMRQRLAIARALLHQPQILFLDEPTRSLDPVATQRLHGLVQQLSAGLGMTIFLITHDLAEAEKLCNRVAVMVQGQVRAVGSPAELRRRLRPQLHYTVQVAGLSAASIEALAQLMPELGRGEGASGATRLQFQAAEDDGRLTAVIDTLRRHEVAIRRIEGQPPTLDDVFTHYLSGADRPMAVIGANQKPVGLYQPLPDGRESERSARPKVALNLWRLWGAFLARDFVTELSYRTAFLLSLSSTFFGAFTFYFLAQLIDGRAAPLLPDYSGDYFSFVLIGLAFGAYFGLGLSGFARTLREAQTTGTLEAMIMTPVPVSAMIIGSAVWSYAFTTFRVFIYLGLGTLLLGVRLTGANYLGALVTLLLSIISFASIGIIAAGIIMVIKRGDPITALFGATANMIGGVYYPVEILPLWLQTLANLLPITYALRAMRQALLAGAGWSELARDLLILLGFCVVLLPLSLLLFRYAVRRARLDGSLTHF